MLVLTVHSNINTVVGCQTPSARALSARNVPSARSALPHDPLVDAGPHIVQERHLQQNTVGPRYRRMLAEIYCESHDEMPQALGAVTDAVFTLDPLPLLSQLISQRVPHRLGCCLRR